MAVAVIGTGNIGSRVARRLAEGGEDVVVAASKPESAHEAAQQIGRGVRAADVKDAIANADVVVFATWFDTTKQLIADNTDALSGKIVVDPSNNMPPTATVSRASTRKVSPRASRSRRCSRRTRATSRRSAFLALKASMPRRQRPARRSRCTTRPTTMPPARPLPS